MWKLIFFQIFFSKTLKEPQLEKNITKKLQKDFSGFALENQDNV